MINWFRKKKHKKESEKQIEKSDDYNFKWYDIGDDNPFNKRILDIRSFTGTMVATTSDKKVAEKYNSLRNSIGEEYKGKTIPNSSKSTIKLEYPHNGTELKGIAFKAESMDCKWDIYVYDNFFYFTRSWTGDLVYKVKAEILKDKIKLVEIEHNDEINSVEAENNVHFLIMTHAVGQPFPHTVPKDMINEKDIAIWSFGQFGNRACYATYDNIIDTEIKGKV